jgi:hypothetical protein
VQCVTAGPVHPVAPPPSMRPEVQYRSELGFQVSTKETVSPVHCRLSTTAFPKDPKGHDTTVHQLAITGGNDGGRRFTQRH